MRSEHIPPDYMTLFWPGMVRHRRGCCLLVRAQDSKGQGILARIRGSVVRSGRRYCICYCHVFRGPGSPTSSR